MKPKRNPCRPVTNLTLPPLAQNSLLCVCDSPTLSTGFARVAQNLIRRWRPHFERIDVWGIGHDGTPAKGEWRNHDIYPAGWPYQTKEKYERVGKMIASGRYSHLWILQDTFNLVLHDFPETLRQTVRLANQARGNCGAPPMRTLLYFPVDAPLDPAWLGILKAVDVPVAYTHYGVKQAQEAQQKLEQLAPNVRSTLPLGGEDFPECLVIPHGMDTGVYRRLPEGGAAARASIFPDGWVREHKLLVNVNAHQRRKGILQSLELLRALLDRGLPVRLYLHMPAHNQEETSILACMAEQLGLKPGDDFRHGGNYFHGTRGLLEEWQLNLLYNSAHAVVTTTLGEGWGLSITEAMAAGTPVWAPDHTSCSEIAAEAARLDPAAKRIHLLPVARQGQVAVKDNCRVRYPIDVARSALLLGDWLAAGAPAPETPLAPALQAWLSWDRIAQTWLQVMGVLLDKSATRC